MCLYFDSISIIIIQKITHIFSPIIFGQGIFFLPSNYIFYRHFNFLGVAHTHTHRETHAHSSGSQFEYEYSLFVSFKFRHIFEFVSCRILICLMSVTISLFWSDWFFIFVLSRSVCVSSSELAAKHGSLKLYWFH